MNRIPISTRASFAAILLIFGLASCDSFLVARCEFEKRECPPPPDAGSNMQDSEMSSPAATGPERAFEWRAKVPLDAKTKFVGLYRNSDAIFLHDFSTTTTPNWQWNQQNIGLLNDLPQSRLTIQACTSCPSLTLIDPINSNTYLAGGTYYSLNGQSKTVNRITPPATSEKLSNINLLAPAPRPFVHPNLDALVVATMPVNPYSSTTTVSVPGDSVWDINLGGTNPTSFVLGDLDAMDIKNGYELILFSGSKVKSVQHQQPLIPDADLQNEIQNTIDSVNSGNETSVTAGFIANLNNDAFIDLLFSSPTKIFATSYLGRIHMQLPAFANWQSPLISYTGEIIRSVVAADLTLDGYPELIVETDKSVHFYLNIPKPQ